MAGAEATLLLKIKQVGGEILDRFVITLGDVINIASQIPDAIMAAVHAFREEELAVNELTQSMINQGIFTADLRSEYIKMAGALESLTTYSDDQIISAQAQLQAMIGNKKVSQELLQATLDLAAGKKIDLASAANLVGKTIGTETDALARQGVVVKEATDVNQKMANVIDAINGKFKDRAAAAAKDLGVMDQLKNSWSNFLENTGAALAPFTISLAKAAKGVLDFFNSMSGPNIGAMNIREIAEETTKLRLKIVELQNAAEMRGGLNAGDKAAIESLQARIDKYQEAKNKIIAAETEAKDRALEIQREKAAKEREERSAQSESEILDLAVKEQIKADAELAAQVAKFDAIIANESNHIARLDAIRQKEKIKKDLSDKLEVKSEEQKNKELLAQRSSFLGQMASLQDSNNKTLAALGKAAAIAQITISTGKSAADGYAWGMAMGGPALAATFQALAYVAGAAQIAKVSGVQLAEGGIVRATPGGIQATIGEGGRDEAVIPLDSPEAAGRLGQGVTVNFNGPIMGDQGTAEAFARAIDKELLKLRQSNQAVSFVEDLV